VELTAGDVSRLCHHFNLGDFQTKRMELGVRRIRSSMNKVLQADLFGRYDETFTANLRAARDAIDALLGEEE
jgi:hypothetical protein